MGESTDRRLRGPEELGSVRFDAEGLVPVVAQDADTGAVLMVAWANRKALEETLATRSMHYWSRSRSTLWRKGETSGNTQDLVSLHLDCDGDTLLALVRPAGPACHTGDPTCFGEGATPDGPPADVLRELAEIIGERSRERPEGSYTTRLLADENLRLKKLGEEVSELVVALARRDPEVAQEAADLVYHLMVALEGAGSSWTEVERTLAERRG
jgi:phosphoribosyl-ATP pyrophosphohydrolase/phosphoribosyl-AMP cyclohydrolase